VLTHPMLDQLKASLPLRHGPQAFAGSSRAADEKPPRSTSWRMLGCWSIAGAHPCGRDKAAGRPACAMPRLRQQASVRGDVRFLQGPHAWLDRALFHKLHQLASGSTRRTISDPVRGPTGCGANLVACALGSTRPCRDNRSGALISGFPSSSPNFALAAGDAAYARISYEAHRRQLLILDALGPSNRPTPVLSVTSTRSFF